MRRCKQIKYMSSEKDYKKQYKPAMCTNPVWKSVITGKNREDIVRQIRAETIQAYGYSMDECPKRLTCFGDSCLGRPLPTLAPTAKPYIDDLKQKFKVINDELFLTKCDQCPIKTKCTSTCHQINDFLNRGNKKEPEVIFQDIPESITEVFIGASINDFITRDIPFDCLSNTRQEVIKKYLYEGKNFMIIAKELNLFNQATAKYEFYAGLTKLSEYATLRNYINENREKLTKRTLLLLEKLYFENKTINEVALEENCSKQAVQQRLTRILNSANIKWEVFVRKENNKLIYNVPMVLK